MPKSPKLNLPEILASHARWDAGDPSGQRANLGGAYLRGASLVGASLDGADLRGASLDGADLRDATGIAIASDAPQRLKAAAAAALRDNALEMSTWHSCNATHCLGGWLIHQAGEVGKLLEAAVGSSVAALMLGGIEAHSHFCDTNEAATEWLRSVLAQPEVSNPAHAIPLPQAGEVEA